MNGPYASLVDQLRRRKASELRQSDLFSFLWAAFDVLHAERADKFEPNWHLKALCHELQKVAEGKEHRLLVTMPPRHLKTVTTSVAFAAWLLGNNPGLRIFIVSYGQTLAGQNLAAVRRVMQSPVYQRTFPGVSVRATGPILKTGQGGYVRAVSVGGAVTGIGADYIIVDDLLKASDAASPQMRESAHAFFQSSILSRFDNKSESRLVVVQQRLHADDLAGRLLEGGTFRHLNLPAIAESDETIEIGPGRTHQRRTEEALFPQREPRKILDQIRAEMTNAVFIPQYQQRTDGAGSGLFQWSWFEMCDTCPDRSEFQMVVQSVDTALAEGPNADYSVCLTFGLKGSDWYLIDIMRTRDTYADFKEKLAASARRMAVDRLIIEHAGAGIPLVRELNREHQLLRRIFPVKPKTSKEVRFATQIERLNKGRFFLPKNAPWLEEFRREMLSFPNGRHDDQVDALTQFLDWLGSRQAIGAVRRTQGWDGRR